MITINGKSYNGNSVSITNGKVIIDGKEVEGGETSSGNVIIEKIEGPVNIDCDMSLTIKGDINSIGEIRSGGSMNCNNVTGDTVRSGGSMNCNNVSAETLKVGGSMNCVNLENGKGK